MAGLRLRNVTVLCNGRKKGADVKQGRGCSVPGIENGNCPGADVAAGNKAMGLVGIIVQRIARVELDDLIAVMEFQFTFQQEDEFFSLVTDLQLVGPFL